MEVGRVRVVRRSRKLPALEKRRTEWSDEREGQLDLGHRVRERAHDARRGEISQVRRTNAFALRHHTRAALAAPRSAHRRRGTPIRRSQRLSDDRV